MIQNTSVLKVKFTDFWHPDTLGDLKNNSLYRLIDENFNIELTESPNFLFYSVFGKNHLNYKCTRIFFTGENVRPNFEFCDYAFSFDYPETCRNFRLPLYRLDPRYDQLPKSRPTGTAHLEERSFCAFVYSNPKPQQRLRFFELLSLYKRVDSGGAVRNNIGRLIENKIDFLKNYKFTIVFENSSYPGYTTEKILHAFLAQSIPIYWGNPRVSEDFNTKSFINCHDYKSFNEVIDVVKKIDGNDALYMEYLSQPYFVDGIENQFSREENVLAKLRTVFFSNKHYIPKVQKWRQCISHKSNRILQFLRRFELIVF